MSDVVFTPSVWIAASEEMQAASDAFSRGAHPVTIARNLTASSSKVDAAIVSADGPLNVSWYELVGKAIEGMNSDASKTSATGHNYAAMEPRGTTAVDRFWS